MAKRKRNSGRGGAFGRSRPAPRISLEGSDLEDGERRVVNRGRLRFQYERLVATGLMARIAMAREGIAPEEVEAAIEAMSGDEIVARFDCSSDPHFRALEVVDALAEDATVEECRSAAERALKIDPDSVDALVLLSRFETEVERALGRLDEAVEAGRRKHRAMPEPGTGAESALVALKKLPYLHALRERATLLQLRGSAAEAKALFEEILLHDPGDSSDSRASLLAIALMTGKLGEAEALLAELPTATSCAALYGRAFVEFLRSLEEAEDFEADMESPEPFAKLRTPRMESARRCLRRAVESSPWTAAFLLDPRSLLVDPAPGFQEGDPYEAIDFARQNHYAWCMVGTPAIWLMSEFAEYFAGVPARRKLRLHHDAFEEICDGMDECDAPETPSLTGAESDDDELMELGAFQPVATQLREILRAAGSPKKRSWRRF